MSPVKPVGGNAGKVALDEGDQRKLNLIVRCSLGEVEACAKLLKSQHVARVRAAGFGSIFKWKVKSNISRPLMGVLYLKIDPDMMTLDMGEANKKLHITSNGIQQLWGRLKEFGAVIGGEVIGILQQLHSWFGEKIAPMLSQIGQSFIELCQSPIVSWFADVFVSGIGVAVQNFFNIVNAVLPHIQGVIEGLLTSFNGILTFLSGVFSLDWQKAWQGVKDIFYGIVQSIGNIFGAIIEKIKGRINGITSQINNVAQKMSNIPVIGGLVQKINIPQFATGTQYFKGGTALVGEHGAELIDMPSGSKVTPADKTKQILKSGNPIAINITVQGNMIGNEQYANQLGNIIIQKIMTAQYNV